MQSFAAAELGIYDAVQQVMSKGDDASDMMGDG